MKKVNKILSVLLSLIMIFSMITMTSITASAAMVGTCGENVTWSLDLLTATLTISGTGEMYDYYDSETDGFLERTWRNYYIEKVIIESGITSIGEGAFGDCAEIMEVVIPNTVKSIDDYAFYGCWNLTEISIPNGVTSIGKRAFMFCNNLENVTMSDSVVSIGEYAFIECHKLKTVSLSNKLNKLNESIFANCHSLENVEIPDSVEVIETTAFYGCTSLKSVTIPNSISSIGIAAFYDCNNLESVYYLGTEEQWEKIEIDEANEPLVNTTIHYNNVKKGTCGKNLTWTFDDSTGTLTISGTGAMDNYSSDIYVDSPSGFSWGISDFQPWHDYDEQIKEVIINEGVVTIGNCAFGGCDNLTRVSIPNSVTTIGDIAFVSCSKLTEITIPNSVTTIGKGAFCGCGIVRITIPDNVTSIGDYAFHSCDNLTNIEVGSRNKYYSSDDYGVLFNKTKTKLMYYPKANISTSYTMPNTVIDIAIFAFANCNNLTNITIPEGVVSIGYCAFSLSANITSITIPSSVTSIGEYAFIMCDDITRIWVNENNKKYSSDEKGVLFNKDKTIIIQYPLNGETSYTIPNSTSTIGDYAFFYSKIASITIPNSVTSIGKNAFGYISTLTDVYYSGTEKQWNQVSIGESNSNLTDATIHFNSSVEEDIYNLGEETYSFDNFGDSHSKGGHCFGMSMTSAAYYNKILDITDIGGSAEKDLYQLGETATVKKPICNYQEKQGPYSKQSIVAGGNWYLTKKNNISSDWNAVVNYVKNHQYDNKGTLQIGFRGSKGGHAINFLRYEVVNGQQRIYAYDNNFPDIETYFYMSSDGNVYQAPKSTFKSAITCICLRDINTYFSIVGDYDNTRYLYGDANEVKVIGAEAYPMECGEGDYTMFELPEEATEIVVKPLVDNATFQYVGEEYSFDEIDENTVGKLTLSEDGDSTTEPDFIITESSEYNVTFYIKEPSITVIRNQDRLVLHAIIENAPEGYYVEWDTDQGNFSLGWDRGDRENVYATAEDKGYDAITATLYDAEGNVLATDYVELYSNSGFFQKIGGFFRVLFGTTKTYDKWS